MIIHRFPSHCTLPPASSNKENEVSPTVAIRTRQTRATSLSSKQQQGQECKAEHCSSSFIPYWKLPYADQWMAGQVEFRQDLTMSNDILANLMNQAVSDDPSLLRFLVDNM